MRETYAIVQLASVGTTLWAVVALARLGSRASGVVLGYLFVYFAMLAIGTAVLFIAKSTSHPAYAAAFNGLFMLMILMAMIAAGEFLSVMPWHLGALGIVFGTGFLCVVTAATYRKLCLLYPIEIPAVQIAAPWKAALLSLCGLLTLLSLFGEHRPAMRIAATGLGILWTSLGAFLFALTVGIVRAHAVWNTRNKLIPALLTIGCCGWMAYRLTLLQPEPLREVSTHVVMEVTR